MFLCLTSTFVSGMCTVASIASFIKGDIALGIYNLIFALANGFLAVYNFTTRGE